MKREKRETRKAWLNELAGARTAVGEERMCSLRLKDETSTQF